MNVSNASPPADKIALFRSLFRGRQEVWPLRFESVRTGRTGYSPVCGNEWVKGVCEKPQVKCGDCRHQRWLPVTDEVIRQHLSGCDERGRSFVAGVYPMLLDEHCCFLAVDFDEDDWSADALAFMTTCDRLGVPASLERSRSGNGGHVWIFFSEPVPASLARRLGSHVLTETMEHRPEVGMKSYDRFFPNQDTLPRGGFGNLIALPLQKAAREQRNSVFVDGNLEPFADQWEFLAGVGRVNRAQLERIVREAEGRGRIVGVRMAEAEEDEGEPWTLTPSRRRLTLPAGPMPEFVELVLADQLYVPKAGLPAPLRNALVRLAAFQNPEFYRAQAMRLPVYDKPRIICCAEEHAEHIGLPRGCLDEALDLFKALEVRVKVNDQRFAGSATELSFACQLTPDQQKAGAAMLSHECGVLSATTAFGKTVLGAWLIAQRGVNTLVLVHREQLMRQWVERLAQFLNLKPSQIGRRGGGTKKLGGTVDVALLQSVVRKGVVDDMVADYGHLIVDECHHLSAHSFELVARRARARFVLGLSATVTRKDGHHPIIWMQCGPVRHRVDARQQAAARPFTHEVVVRPTGFLPEGTPESDARLEYRRLCEAVMRSPSRNARIIAEVVAAVEAGRSPVVLTERAEHLELLAAGVRAAGVPHVISLRGGLGRKALGEALERLTAVPAEAGRVVVATGRFLGEGFDDPRLDTLFLTMPVSWRGTIAQYAGRLHRLHAGKTVVQVHDYADLEVPMLSRMFDKRCRGYEAVGYTILVPANALPGWPQDVPLPVDAEWKADYSASVRRLIRDGVETPLARLFVRAARRVEPGAEGAARARSASEAFIFQRFETLPALRGRFRLNERLPIPFDDMSQMEVDLLCDELRVVIEIDGGQHLGDADAYRRDRRKDLLLQSHGYLVLRFLAEDLGKRLDALMDTVLRVVASRR